MQHLPALREGGHTARLAASHCHRSRQLPPRGSRLPHRPSPKLAIVRGMPQGHPRDMGKFQDWRDASSGSYSRTRVQLVLPRLLIREQRLKSTYQVGRPAQTKITQCGRGEA